jgi:hypothetical protein
MKTVTFMFLCFKFAACIAKYIIRLISVDNLVSIKLAEINDTIFTNSSTRINIYVGEPGVIY